MYNYRRPDKRPGAGGESGGNSLSYFLLSSTATRRTVYETWINDPTPVRGRTLRTLTLRTWETPPSHPLSVQRMSGELLGICSFRVRPVIHIRSVTRLIFGKWTGEVVVLDARAQMACCASLDTALRFSFLNTAHNRPPTRTFRQSSDVEKKI